MWNDIKGIEYVFVGNGELEMTKLDNVNVIIIVLLIR